MECLFRAVQGRGGACGVFCPGEFMTEDRPVRIVTEKELADISGAFGYDSATPHGWAKMQLAEIKNFIVNGGVIEIPFAFGRLPPQKLDSLALYMNWRNEVWGGYYI